MTECIEVSTDKNVISLKQPDTVRGGMMLNDLFLPGQKPSRTQYGNFRSTGPISDSQNNVVFSPLATSSDFNEKDLL